MRAFLVRHAQSTGQAPEAPLSEEGQAQARRLAEALSARAAGPLYSSPYTRACQTLAPYAELTAQSVTMLDNARERLLSPTPLDDWQFHIAQSFEDPAHAAPGGESMDEVRHRASSALLRIERSGGRRPVLVTHGGVLSALFHAADPSFGFEEWRTLRNPDLFEVTLISGHIDSFTRLDLTEDA